MVGEKKFGISSFVLHIIAITTMLIDHSGYTISQKAWMNGVGRLAFPIFAFMIVEGYYHTKNLKNYLSRLFIFALISEIPFNLMVSSNLFFPFYQNVLWTFLISLYAIIFIEKVKNKYSDKKIIKFILIVIIVLLAYLIGMLALVDYYGYGIIIVLTFYFFHGKEYWKKLAQVGVLAFLNIFLLGKYSVYFINIGNLRLPIQSLAILSLPIIWLYNGQQGYYNKFMKYLFYTFYPAHMLILALIELLFLG